MRLIIYLAAVYIKQDTIKGEVTFQVEENIKSFVFRSQ